MQFRTSGGQVSYQWVSESHHPTVELCTPKQVCIYLLLNDLLSWEDVKRQESRPQPTSPQGARGRTAKWSGSPSAASMSSPPPPPLEQCPHLSRVIWNTGLPSYLILSQHHQIKPLHEQMHRADETNHEINRSIYLSLVPTVPCPFPDSRHLLSCLLLCLLCFSHTHSRLSPFHLELPPMGIRFH